MWFRGRSPQMCTLPTLCTARPGGKGIEAPTWAEPRHSQNHNLLKARARSGVRLCFQTQPLNTAFSDQHREARVATSSNSSRTAWDPATASTPRVGGGWATGPSSGTGAEEGAFRWARR